MNVDPIDLSSVLLWIIAGPGAAWVIGQVVSLLAEHVPAWHKLKPPWKLLITLVLAAGLPILAQLLISQREFMELIGPYWTMAVSGIVAWLAMQSQYIKIKETTYAERFKPEP